MHLIVPFAGPPGAAARAALPALAPALPQLQALLKRLGVSGRDDGDAWSFTPPHERALARAFGWTGADGCLPWAARQAAADGIAADGRAWGLLTPVHWHLGTDQVSLVDPATLLLDAATSRHLFDAVRELFTSEGFQMVFGAAERWYVAHGALAGLRCASLDRVVGRNVDAWLVDRTGAGADAAAAIGLLRRLQNEVQMLLYTHPANDRREAQGLLPVNSFWLSGCGVAQAVAGAAVQVDTHLRAPALADDVAGWTAAWQTLDAGPLAAMRRAAADGQTVRLTLCGERSAVSYQPEGGAWQRLRALWARPDAAAVLDAL